MGLEGSSRRGGGKGLKKEEGGKGDEVVKSTMSLVYRRMFLNQTLGLTKRKIIPGVKGTNGLVSTEQDRRVHP